jgi:hypothetical protein
MSEDKIEYCEKCDEPVKAGVQCEECGAVDGVPVWGECSPNNDDWIQRLWWDANPPSERDLNNIVLTRMEGR